MTVLVILLVCLVFLLLALFSSAKEDIDFLLSNRHASDETLIELKHAFDNLHEGFSLLRKYNEIQDERLAELETHFKHPDPQNPNTTITCDSTSENVISDDAPKPKKRSRKKEGI